MVKKKITPKELVVMVLILHFVLSAPFTIRATVNHVRKAYDRQYAHKIWEEKRQECKYLLGVNTPPKEQEYSDGGQFDEVDL